MKSRNQPTQTFLNLGLAAILATPVLLAAPRTADADVRVRVHGKVRVRVAPSIVVRYHPHRTHRPRHRLHIRGSIHLGGGIVYGGGYAEPPPPPPPSNIYDCEPDVPAYYTPAPPPRVYQPPTPVVVAPAPRIDPLGPRFGIGLFAGSMNVDGNGGEDVGAIARYRLTRSLSLEGELAKTTIELDETRRMGGALSWDLSPNARLSPNLLAGVGSWDSRGYGEVGAGLTYRLSQRLHIAADVRAGARAAAEQDAPVADGSRVMKVIGDQGSGQDERYTRGRLSAILYF